MRTLDEKWTPAQRDAIRSRGETLLVSAAAGSGKTAVLTERIIDRLLDDDNALDLSGVLVVTFTKAAAAELKTRIRAALDREIAADPDNRRLQTQLLSVGRAKICTIDSFCLDLIRSHFDVLGLSPRVSVSDDTEAKLLSKTVMRDLIDDYFEDRITEDDEKIEDFGAFSDLFVTARAQDTLAETLLAVRETVNGYEEGVDRLFLQAERLKKDARRDFLSGETGGILYRALDAFARRTTAEYDAHCAFLSTDDVYLKNYGECFFYERDWCKTLCTLLSGEEDGRFDRVRAHFASFVPPRLGSGIRGDKKTDDVVRVKARHDAFKEKRESFYRRYFAVSAEECSRLTAAQAEITEKLGVFLSLYEHRLAEEKQQRQILDFGDLGRMALTLLWDRKKGEPTPLAQAVADRYTEIYIDEYQDVSPVQDRIFASIAKPNNRFMVGDAKQSIYGFRGASPELFLGYRTVFDRHPAQGRTIFLSENFRCDRQVIDFSNLIFSVLFSGSDIPYTAADALKCAKPVVGEDVQKRVSLALIGGSEEDGDVTEAEPSDAEATDTEDATAYTEADYVADTVQYLLATGHKRDGSRIRPRDIAVLVRSAKSSAQPLSDALTKRGIPSYNSVSRAFFENAEVLLVYSLLSVIDNPERDVFLAGALKSPLYRVTLDELIYMRKKYPHGSLYRALCAFTEETGFAKGRYFLDCLSRYRRRATGMQVDRFLWQLYEETGILSLVWERERNALFPDMADDAQRGTQMRANLMMFYEYARMFERGSFQGLYRFVAFIGSIIEEKQEMPPVLLSGDDADAVRIMTVHQSKGLEFPVCFLSGCAKKFNDSDARRAILLHREAGFASYLRDETGLARIDHPVRECIRESIRLSAAEEEKRVLYVALTRAREQLYLSASVSDPAKRLDACTLLRPEDLTSGAPTDASDVLSWMLAALAVTGDAGRAVCDMILPTENPWHGTPMTNDVPCAETAETAASEMFAPQTPSYRAVLEIARRAADFVYPNAQETQLPSKLSVSQLHELHTQTESPAHSVTESDASVGDTSPTYAMPRFLSGEGDTPTPAQRGTATHEFMQFCDFSALADQSRTAAERINGEISRLVAKQFLTGETASRIDRRALAVFLKSTLFDRLCHAVSVRREVRFNFHVPAKTVDPALTTDAEVLVQGIIDCYYRERDGRVILIDYKTDHFSRAALSDSASVESVLRSRHAQQLSYYRDALSEILCACVDEVRIYSFALGYDFPVF